MSESERAWLLGKFLRKLQQFYQVKVDVDKTQFCFMSYCCLLPGTQEHNCRNEDGDTGTDLGPLTRQRTQLFLSHITSRHVTLHQVRSPQCSHFQYIFITETFHLKMSNTTANKYRKCIILYCIVDHGLLPFSEFHPHCTAFLSTCQLASFALSSTSSQ